VFSVIVQALALLAASRHLLSFKILLDWSEIYAFIIKSFSSTLFPIITYYLALLTSSRAPTQLSISAKYILWLMIFLEHLLNHSVSGEYIRPDLSNLFLDTYSAFAFIYIRVFIDDLSRASIQSHVFQWVIWSNLAILFLSNYSAFAFS
jgi:hypothetical protein